MNTMSAQIEWPFAVKSLTKINRRKMIIENDTFEKWKLRKSEHTRNLKLKRTKPQKCSKRHINIGISIALTAKHTVDNFGGFHSLLSS